MKKNILLSLAFFLLACEGQSKQYLSLPLLDSSSSEFSVINDDCITSEDFSIKILPVSEENKSYGGNYHNLYQVPDCQGDSFVGLATLGFVLVGLSKKYAIFKEDEVEEYGLLDYRVIALEKIIKDDEAIPKVREFYPIDKQMRLSGELVYYYESIRYSYLDFELDSDEKIMPPQKEECPNEQLEQVDQWVEQGAGFGLAQATVLNLLTGESQKMDQIICYPAIPVQEPEEGGLPYELIPTFKHELPLIKDASE